MVIPVVEHLDHRIVLEVPVRSSSFPLNQD
jgi:hypothetical protein